MTETTVRTTSIDDHVGRINNDAGDARIFLERLEGLARCLGTIAEGCDGEGLGPQLMALSEVMRSESSSLLGQLIDIEHQVIAIRAIVEVRRRRIQPVAVRAALAGMAEVAEAPTNQPIA